MKLNTVHFVVGTLVHFKGTLDPYKTPRVITKVTLDGTRTRYSVDGLPWFTKGDLEFIAEPDTKSIDKANFINQEIDYEDS